MMNDAELQSLISSRYATVPQVKSISVYAHPQERTVRIMVDAGMTTEYNNEVMDRLLEAEYAIYKELERRMDERWIMDVSYV